MRPWVLVVLSASASKHFGNSCCTTCQGGSDNMGYERASTEQLRDQNWATNGREIPTTTRYVQVGATKGEGQKTSTMNMKMRMVLLWKVS